MSSSQYEASRELELRTGHGVFRDEFCRLHSDTFRFILTSVGEDLHHTRSVHAYLFICFQSCFYVSRCAAYQGDPKRNRVFDGLSSSLSLIFIADFNKEPD